MPGHTLLTGWHRARLKADGSATDEACASPLSQHMLAGARLA